MPSIGRMMLQCKNGVGKEKSHRQKLLLYEKTIAGHNSQHHNNNLLIVTPSLISPNPRKGIFYFKISLLIITLPSHISCVLTLTKPPKIKTTCLYASHCHHRSYCHYCTDFMLSYNVTCYTDSLLANIYVNTTNSLIGVEVWFPQIGCSISLTWTHQGWAGKCVTLVLLQFLIF